ncbi:MAG: metallophosphoesterase family protein [Pseudomonadota bacterium]
MRLAVIADVHGNFDALDAVLADIRRAGADRIVNLGDHVSGPLDARGTADCLMATDMLCLRGNHDRWVLGDPAGDMGPSDRVAAAQLSDAHTAWLAALPPTLDLDGAVFACHGTPTSDETYWLEAVDATGTPHLADRAQIESHAAGLEADVLLCAHTHIPRTVVLADGRRVVNPGSVGCPAYDDTKPRYHRMQTGSPDARYALVERVAGHWTVAFRQVRYNTKRMVALARQHGRAEWASAVATGWVAAPE